MESVYNVLGTALADGAVFYANGAVYYAGNSGWSELYPLGNLTSEQRFWP